MLLTSYCATAYGGASLPRTEADPPPLAIPVFDRPSFEQERIGIRRGWRVEPGCRVGQALIVRRGQRHRSITDCRKRLAWQRRISPPYRLPVGDTVPQSLKPQVD